MGRKRVAFHLVWIALLFVTVAGLASTIESAPGPAPDRPVVSAPDASTAIGPATDDFTPVACKMRPQCSTDEDCVAWCGSTGGHCVHSSCPIRICKCS